MDMRVDEGEGGQTGIDDIRAGGSNHSALYNFPNSRGGKLGRVPAK